LKEVKVLQADKGGRGLAELLYDVPDLPVPHLVEHPLDLSTL
jgi:hypothetical protein